MTLGTNIAKALVAIQAEMTDAVKDSKNPFFKSKYADLNAVREAVLPAATKHKVAILQPVILLDSGKSVVRTTLVHESGETYSADTEVVCAKQNDPQAMGSAISYSRRYGLQSFFNVGAVDDDGEAGMGRKTQQAESKEEAPAQEQAAPAAKPKPFTRAKPATTTKPSGDIL
jgi:hypothetical protein